MICKWAFGVATLCHSAFPSGTQQTATDKIKGSSLGERRETGRGRGGRREHLHVWGLLSRVQFGIHIEIFLSASTHLTYSTHTLSLSAMLAVLPIISTVVNFTVSQFIVIHFTVFLAAL